MGPINLRNVEFFVAAADAGTMTAAGEQMHVSQSAVSLAVRRLEAELGAQLFIRLRSRGLRLTETGRAFLPSARDLLALADDVANQVSVAGTGVRGRLEVGCFGTIAPFLLPELLETFGRRYPDVELSFLEAPMPALEDALRSGRCELALAYDLGIHPDIAFEPLYQAVPYVLLGAEDPLVAEAEIDLTTLAKHDLVLLDVPPSAEYILGVFAAVDEEPQIRYRTSSYELVRSLVGRGLGYSLPISRPVADVTYEGRELVARPLGGAPKPIGLGIARHESVRSTRRAHAFAQHCRETLAESIGGAAAVGSGRRGLPLRRL